MWEGRVEKSVNVEILLDEVIVALVVLADGLLHAFELVLRLVVPAPSISRIAIANQSLAAHLLCHESIRCIAAPSVNRIGAYWRSGNWKRGRRLRWVKSTIIEVDASTIAANT